ncbi:DNA replication terminus site-binding protein [Pseudomonas sp. NCHU5208]|uniref:DNA replication terminus site-binding protein n=1 Tax=unclassified Pseudomonas TaxID=196821 RepID=UPI003F9E23E8
MTSTSTTTDAIDAASRLVEALHTLRSGLIENRDLVRLDAAFGIDLRETDRVNPAASIQVEPLEGDTAFDLAVEALTSVHLRPNQNPRSTLRVPGAIGLPKDLLEQVRHCNDLRNQLYLKVHGIQAGRPRQAVWKRTGITSALQALRQTVILECPHRISFFWNVGTSVDRYQVSGLKKELLEQLQQNAVDGQVVPKEMTQPFDLEGLHEKSVERRLKTQLNVLFGLPDGEQIVLLRPVRAHVRARVSHSPLADGTCPEASKPMSTVPFVYDREHPAPIVVPLNNFDPKSLTAPRSKYSNAQLEPSPWNEAMNLYRYRDHRTEPLEISDKLSRVKRLQNLKEGNLN